MVSFWCEVLDSASGSTGVCNLGFIVFLRVGCLVCVSGLNSCALI
jgi:hypothetical protein